MRSSADPSPSLTDSTPTLLAKTTPDYADQDADDVVRAFEKVTAALG